MKIMKISVLEGLQKISSQIYKITVRFKVRFKFTLNWNSKDMDGNAPLFLLWLHGW